MFWSEFAVETKKKSTAEINTLEKEIIFFHVPLKNLWPKQHSYLKRRGKK